jgi:hypothetical protein
MLSIELTRRTPETAVSPLLSRASRRSRSAMPIRPRFLRRLAWELVVTGLVVGSVGEILVINNELLSVVDRFRVTV